MKVRDHTKSINEYNGKWTDAYDEFCPCRPCFNAHNCEYRIEGKYIENFVCAHRENEGCPAELPRPMHIFKLTKRFQNRKKGDKFKCLRCAETIAIGSGSSDFDFIAVEKKFKVGTSA